MIRMAQNLLPPVMNGYPDVLAQRFNRDRIDQQCWSRPCQGDSQFTNHPSNENRIAVSRLEKRATPVVEIPELLTLARMVPQGFLREVGAFQMLGPRDVEAIDMLVYCLQTMNFLRREFFFYHDDEVNIAVKIEIAHREGTLQVGTHEGEILGDAPKPPAGEYPCTPSFSKMFPDSALAPAL